MGSGKILILGQDAVFFGGNPNSLHLIFMNGMSISERTHSFFILVNKFFTLTSLRAVANGYINSVCTFYELHSGELCFIILVITIQALITMCMGNNC